MISSVVFQWMARNFPTIWITVKYVNGRLWTTGLVGYLIFLGAAILACHLKLCLDQLYLLLVFLLKVSHSLLLLIHQPLPLGVWTTDRTLRVTFLIKIHSPQCLCCSCFLRLQDQFLIQIHCRPCSLLQHFLQEALTHCLLFTIKLISIQWGSHDSAVGRTTRLRAGQFSNCGWILISSEVSRLARGPTHPPVRWVAGTLSPG